MQDGSELSNLRDQISDNTTSHLMNTKRKADLQDTGRGVEDKLSSIS